MTKRKNVFLMTDLGLYVYEKNLIISLSTINTLSYICCKEEDKPL